jgi:hypothetical protein
MSIPVVPVASVKVPKTDSCKTLPYLFSPSVTEKMQQQRDEARFKEKEVDSPKSQRKEVITVWQIQLPMIALLPPEESQK